MTEKRLTRSVLRLEIIDVLVLNARLVELITRPISKGIALLAFRDSFLLDSLTVLQLLVETQLLMALSNVTTATIFPSTAVLLTAP